MSVVVGLDLSLVRTGIAILSDGRPTMVRSVGHAGVSGANYRDRSRRITSQCRAVTDALNLSNDPLRQAPPDLAVIEGPNYGQNLPSTFDRAGLWWGVYAALAHRRIPVVIIPPSSLKVWTTGKGRADKTDMLAAVREWGWTPANHDEADALSLASVGAFHLGDPVPFKVKDRHAATLERVAMPTMEVGA